MIMVFSSVSFTFLFLPIVLLLSFLFKGKASNFILLIASLIFYAIGEPKAVLLMLFSIVINYLAGLIVSGKKVVLVADIVVNLGILYYFKYLDYTIEVFNLFTGSRIQILNIVLPIGISFFTFQAMSYVIDVYRGDAQVEKNILNVGLYISFFPQLVAGPIVRYNTIAEQIRSRTRSLEKFGEGVKRFLVGFAKKVLLANNLALVADQAFRFGEASEQLKTMPIALAWLGSIAFSLQIYFDFSGYSDMAIGLGRMFGFEFQENFNYPYSAKSITDFWRRWHISLSQWFRDYVYIPLGGSRNGSGRQVFNLFVVWALTGLWHGANVTFVAWGLMYFVMLILEKMLVKPSTRGKALRVCWQILTLLIVNFGWILFNIESFDKALAFMGSMFGLYHNAISGPLVIGLLRDYWFFMFFGIVFSIPVIPKLLGWITDALADKKWAQLVQELLTTAILMTLFLWSVSYLVTGAHNPFIYFNF